MTVFARPTVVYYSKTNVAKRVSVDCNHSLLAIAHSASYQSIHTITQKTKIGQRTLIVNSIKESVYKGLLTYSEIFISVTSVIELCVHDALDDIFHIIAVFLAKTLQHLWPRLTANPFSFLRA